MKKLLLIVGLSLLLTACGGGETKTDSAKETTTTEEKTTQQTTEEKKTEEVAVETKKDTYGIGEEWIVDGQWKLTVNSVTATEDRNEYSEKKPAEVVIITYSYENIGYEDDIQDLFLNPSKVIDGSKKMADTYPGNIVTYPQPTPVGAMMENAEDCWGLINESETIQVIFENYDMNGKNQKATFEVPVTK